MDKLQQQKLFDTLVVSAPSGAGKSTLNQKILSLHPELELSVSYTTRAIRKGDIDGVHYHFVSMKEFEDQINNQKMLEYARVFGNYYGTSLKEIERIEQNHKIPLLEIDVQGWKQIKSRLKNPLSIFIFPPSIKVLWHRLRNRASDSREVQIERIMTAKKEILEAKYYDYFIVNSEIEASIQEFEQIIKQKKCSLSFSDGINFSRKLLSEYEEPWFKELDKQ